MTPISICTIFKNEEKHLESFLSAIAENLSGYPHEIILTDTGSDDRSPTLIRDFVSGHPEYSFSDTPSDKAEKSQKQAESRYSIRLSFFPWTGDFAAAKNHAVSLARNEWVLVLDADEYLTAFDTSCIDRMIRQYPGGIGMVKRINRTLSDGIGNATSEEIPRFFNRNCHHYEGIIHEQLVPGSLSGSIRVPDTASDAGSIARVMLPVTIDHYGYIGTVEELRAKAGRNNALLFKMLEKTPDDPYLYYQIGQSYSIIKDYENAYLYYGKGLEFDVDERLEYVQDMVIGYGYAMLETGRAEEALGYEGIYDSFSSSADFLSLMGLIYMRNGMIEEAYREFENAVMPGKTCRVAGSGSYLAYYNMGIIDEAVGNIEKALSLYQKCGSFKPAEDRIRELA